MADSGLGQEMYKMYLEQLVISESGEAVLPKITQEQTYSALPSQRWDNLMNRKIMAMDQNTSKYSKTQSSVHNRSWCGSWIMAVDQNTSGKFKFMNS